MFWGLPRTGQGGNIKGPSAFRQHSQPVEATIPFALKFTTRAVELFLVVAQVHFAVLLYRLSRRKRLRFAMPLSVVAGAVGLFLVGISELVSLHLETHEFGRQLPRILHLVSAVHVAGSFGAYAIYLVWSLARRLQRPSEHRVSAVDGLSRRSFLDGAAQTAMAAPFLVGGYGAFIVRDDFEVRETELRIKRLPSDLDGLRIAQVSDIHFGPYLGRKELKRIVGMTNELRPHVTFLTGDFITREGDALEECLDILAGLRADSGVWGCLGNHEEFAKCRALAKRYAATRGIQILRQESRVLRFGHDEINLVGVDYQRQSAGYLPTAADWVKPGAFNLLLSHNPDVFPTAAALGYDLTLAGHTHGGQVTVEIVEQTLNPGRFFTPFVVGEYRIGEKAAYVTRGVGTVNMPMRIGARPEVSSLILRSV